MAKLNFQQSLFQSSEIETSEIILQKLLYADLVLKKHFLLSLFIIIIII